jgi:GMP synthase-like glutamine amidotransferase
MSCGSWQTDGVPRAAVLSHDWIAHELGHLEPWLIDSGFSIVRVYREEQPSIPDGDLLIVMGSPHSVVPGFRGASADAEIEAVRAWVAQDRPYLGLCFGAQVLATALGGSVRRMPQEFLGYVPVDADTPHTVLGDGQWTVWHNDGITAPPTSELLGSLDHADLAFRVGRAWGLQPHIEVTPETLERMAVALGSTPEQYQPIVDKLHGDAVDNASRARVLLGTFLEQTSMA